MMKGKLKAGALISFSVGKGVGLFQVLPHQSRDWGILIRVFSGVHPEPLSKQVVDAVLSTKESFLTFIPLSASSLLSSGELYFLGSEPVPERLREFPLFRAAGLRDTDLRSRDWWLWDGRREWRAGSLSEEQRSLSIRELVGIGVLVDRVAAGWTPEWDTDLEYRRVASLSQPARVRPADPIPLGGFWRIVEIAAEKALGNQSFNKRLQKELRAMSAKEVAGFARQLDALLLKAYTWDLWGAAYIMNGGCSDDCFLYFRAWLVSQGREIFEAAVAEAESLAGAQLKWEANGFDNEDLLGIASTVYRELTDEELEVSGDAEPPEPAGEPWSEEPAELKRRWPRLWSRFGP
jgi:hypothetical protein